MALTTSPSKTEQLPESSEQLNIAEEMENLFNKAGDIIAKFGSRVICLWLCEDSPSEPSNRRIYFKIDWYNGVMELKNNIMKFEDKTTWETKTIEDFQLEEFRFLNKEWKSQKFWNWKISWEGLKLTKYMKIAENLIDKLETKYEKK